MNAPARPKPLPWDELKSRLDENQPFNMMRGTPYYRDAVYEQFSAPEYARRYAAIRAKMRAKIATAVFTGSSAFADDDGGGVNPCNCRSSAGRPPARPRRWRA